MSSLKLIIPEAPFVDSPSTVRKPLLSDPPARHLYSPESAPLRFWMASTARFFSLFMLYFDESVRGFFPLNQRTRRGEGVKPQLRVIEPCSLVVVSSSGWTTASRRSG